MNVRMHASWKSLLASEFAQDYFKTLTDFVKNEYTSNEVFPPAKAIFRAFDTTPVDDVKVVILGQDPYHGPDQANGLSFAVNEGVRLPPSLKNIYKELMSDLKIAPTEDGDLTRWANQGVLLLNATLTVKARTPGSHQKKGWEEFTDAAIQKLSEEREGLVFILWGKYAQNKGAVISRINNHLIIQSPHPSPFSAHTGFFGSSPFSKTNTFLMMNGQDPIKW